MNKFDDVSEKDLQEMMQFLDSFTDDEIGRAHV